MKKGGTNLCHGDEVGADSQPELSEDYAALLQQSHGCKLITYSQTI
jgi:hypothetical protein